MKKPIKSANRTGVTLIELLIVVLILAALSAIAIPRISQSAANAKANACRTNVDTINSTLEILYANRGWPASDLLEVTDDTAYFPDGEPICPVTGAVYPVDLVNDRTDASAHAH